MILERLIGSFLFGSYQKTIFTIIGVGFMLVGGCSLSADISFSRNAIEHTGVIFRIDSIQGETDKTPTVNVKYTVSGQEYEGEIRNARGWSIGDEIKIYYHRKKPSKIQVNKRVSDSMGDVIFFTVGFILLLTGRWDKILTIKKRFENRNAMNKDAVYSENVFTQSQGSLIQVVTRFIMKTFGWLIAFLGFFCSAVLLHIKRHPDAIEVIGSGGSSGDAEAVQQVNTIVNIGLLLSIGILFLGIFIWRKVR